MEAELLMADLGTAERRLEAKKLSPEEVRHWSEEAERLRRGERARDPELLTAKPSFVVANVADAETEAPAPLQSNRSVISRAAWSTALRTSWRSTSDTMSNENWSFAMGQS